MVAEKFQHSGDTAVDRPKSSLKKAVIIYAIIEALVLIPLVIYLIVR